MRKQCCWFLGLVIGCGAGMGVAASAEEAAPPVADAGLAKRLDQNRDGQVTADEVSGGQARLFARLLKVGDANGDGALDAEELAAALQPSRAGESLEPPATSEPPGAAATRAMLLLLDTKPDGRIVRDEVPEEYVEAFDRLKEVVSSKDDVLDRYELTRAGGRLNSTTARLVGRLGIDPQEVVARLTKEQGDNVNRFDRMPRPEDFLGNGAQAKDAFKNLDLNNDGQLAVDELPEPLRERLQRFFQVADANRDKKLSEAEFDRARSRLARVLGVEPSEEPMMDAPPMMESASSPERESAPAGQAQTLATRLVTAAVRRMDRNGDGVIERSEAQGRLAAKFDEADADGNGRIDRREQRLIAELLGDRLPAGAKRRVPPK